jgi:excisionase family DNA binding protein
LLSNKVLLSIPEFSVLASISPRTTAKLIASGEVRSIRIGRRRLIARSELALFVKRDHATSEVRSALPKKGGR